MLHICTEMLRWSGLPEVLPATSSLSVLCEDRNTRVQPVSPSPAACQSFHALLCFDLTAISHFFL